MIKKPEECKWRIITFVWGHFLFRVSHGRAKVHPSRVLARTCLQSLLYFSEQLWQFCKRFGQFSLVNYIIS